MKISKDPWQLMVKIRLNRKYFIILLICDNVIILIIQLIRLCNLFIEYAR